MRSKILIFSVKPKEANMPAAIEARERLEVIFSSQHAGEPLKRFFERMARRLRLSVRRIETIWRGTAVITADEMERIRALALATTEETHADRLDRAIRTLEALDPDFYGPEIDRLRRVSGELRGLALR